MTCSDQPSKYSFDDTNPNSTHVCAWLPLSLIESSSHNNAAKCGGQPGSVQPGSVQIGSVPNRKLHSSKHSVTTFRHALAMMMLGWQNSSYSVSNFQFVEPSGIGSEDSVEGGGMDAEGSGDLRNGFSLLDEPAGEVSLLLVHLFGSTETYSAFSCVCAPRPSALPNQISFEFCYPRENGHDHLAGMRGSVSPGFRN